MKRRKAADVFEGGVHSRIILALEDYFNDHPSDRKLAADAVEGGSLDMLDRLSRRLASFTGLPVTSSMVREFYKDMEGDMKTGTTRSGELLGLLWECLNESWLVDAPFEIGADRVSKAEKAHKNAARIVSGRIPVLGSFDGKAFGVRFYSRGELEEVVSRGHEDLGRDGKWYPVKALA